jgi:LDH2 family malate/lactate/ureidoglycolate dehydrogenase
MHMSTQTLIHADDLGAFIANVLRKLDVPADDAAIVAERLVFAHLRGYDTHGLPLLAGYVECLEQGRINARPNFGIERPLPWSVRLDADNGLGQLAGHRAMRLALDAAEQFGIGATAVRGANHFGAASCYSTLALASDCIGIVTSNAAPAAAPFGALQPFLGTNPLSVAVPAHEQPPFVIDMATTEGSRKKVRKALADGVQLPAGWAVDKDGNATTNPQAALDGVMLPFGGMKGSAITILLDVLSGVLTGAEFGGQVLSVMTNQQRACNSGNFMLAIKLSAFMPPAEFKRRMDEELGRIRKLRPAKGVKEVIYPGFKSHFTEIERRARGIALPATQIEEAQALGAKLSVVFPTPR